MKTILVVDDESVVLRAARMLLELEGYRVLVAEHGAEALDRLNGTMPEGRPDLVLTDRMMPVLDGIGLCRTLRDRADLDGVPIVLMSAADEPREHRGLYDAFMQKPFIADDLLVLIEKLLAAGPDSHQR